MPARLGNDALSHPNLHLMVVLSLGRSGSTFLARVVSENTDFWNAGENRYFWQELAKKPQETHAKEIAKYYARKNPNSRHILDKTPELYLYVDQIDFGDHRVDWIELVRAPAAIEASRARFLTSLRQPKRILMRIRKYRRDYGKRWVVPVLQRWHLGLALFGIGRERAFATGHGGGDVNRERLAFDKAIASLRQRTTVLTIDYDNFGVSARGLATLGLSERQIEAIVSRYRR